MSSPTTASTRSPARNDADGTPPATTEPMPIMVPFTEADVPVVDLAAGRLVIASLDDWLGGDDTAETPE